MFTVKERVHVAHICYCFSLINIIKVFPLLCGLPRNESLNLKKKFISRLNIKMHDSSPVMKIKSDVFDASAMCFNRVPSHLLLKTAMIVSLEREWSWDEEDQDHLDTLPRAQGQPSQGQPSTAFSHPSVKIKYIPILYVRFILSSYDFI